MNGYVPDGFFNMIFTLALIGVGALVTAGCFGAYLLITWAIF